MDLTLFNYNENWPTHGVFIDAYVKSGESGKEEKLSIDVCLHIGCVSNDEQKRKDFLNDYQKRIHQPGGIPKLYLSPEFNSSTKEGRKAVIKYITSRFDTCGGGIMSAGARTNNPNAISFRCFRHKPAKLTATKKKTTSDRPNANEEKCLWKFTLFFEPSLDAAEANKGRYYFYKNGSGNRFHNGHAPYAKKAAGQTSQKHSLGMISAMSMFKPTFETIVSAIDGDDELCGEFQDTLVKFHSHAMAKKRKMKDEPSTEGNKKPRAAPS